MLIRSFPQTSLFFFFLLVQTYSLHVSTDMTAGSFQSHIFMESQPETSKGLSFSQHWFEIPSKGLSSCPSLMAQKVSALPEHRGCVRKGNGRMLVRYNHISDQYIPIPSQYHQNLSQWPPRWANQWQHEGAYLGIMCHGWKNQKNSANFIQNNNPFAF